MTGNSATPSAPAPRPWDELSPAERVQKTTSFVALARVPVFQPTNRPTPVADRQIETASGTCRVTGRLGQPHIDLLETLIFNAERVSDEPDGSVGLLVDPHKVRTGLSDTRTPIPQIQKLLEELMEAVIVIEIRRGQGGKMLWMGGLIDLVEPASKTRPGPFGQQRQLWKLKMGKLFVSLLASDFPVRYDPAPIARLRHGISKAVVRHLLGHTQLPAGGWKLDTLLLAVTGQLEGRQLRDARRYLIADSEDLSKLGVAVDAKQKRISYRKPSRAR